MRTITIDKRVYCICSTSCVLFDSGQCVSRPTVEFCNENKRFDLFRWERQNDICYLLTFSSLHKRLSFMSLGMWCREYPSKWNFRVDHITRRRWKCCAFLEGLLDRWTFHFEINTRRNAPPRLNKLSSTRLFFVNDVCIVNTRKVEFYQGARYNHRRGNFIQLRAHIISPPSCTHTH